MKLKCAYFAFLSLLLALSKCFGQRFTLQDLGTSAGDIVRGIDLTSELLNPEYIGQVSMNLYKGLPAVLGITALNTACSGVSARGVINPIPEFTPRIDQIKLQLRTACEKRSYGLTEVQNLLQNPNFDPQRQTIIFATGWNTTINDGRHDVVAKAYNCRGSNNYFALDNADYINTLYTWSAVNTDTIGRFLADILRELIKILPIQNIHLIGHGLGAQIMGYASRYFSEATGIQMPYVTGLDPALPCFSEGELLNTLAAGDAAFVDVIHTSPGVYGQAAATGDVDFYLDGKFSVLQGCGNPICSHERILLYYAETVYPGNENDFLGKRCTSLRSLQAGRCRSEEAPMGYAVPRNLKGHYIVQVNGTPPFGKNATQNYTPFNTKCGTCSIS